MSDCPAFLLEGRQRLTGLKSELTFGARLLVRGRGHGPSSPLTRCRGHPEDPPPPLVRAFQPLSKGRRLQGYQPAEEDQSGANDTFKLKSSAGIKAKRQPSSADLQHSLGQGQTITRDKHSNLSFQQPTHQELPNMEPWRRPDRVKPSVFRHGSVTELNVVISVMDRGVCGPVLLHTGCCWGLVPFISQDECGGLRSDSSRQTGLDIICQLL